MKKIMMALGIIFIAIQFIQPPRNRSDKMPATDIVNTLRVPANVKALLGGACYDCHSNNTSYPWYSRIQPFAWLLAKHVKGGKEKLNFSEFGTYSSRRQISKLNGISKSVENGSMPLASYKALHKMARLSDEDRAILVTWASGTRDSLELIK
jgi:hypothetical protein